LEGRSNSLLLRFNNSKHATKTELRVAQLILREKNARKEWFFIFLLPPLLSFYTVNLAGYRNKK